MNQYKIQSFVTIKSNRVMLDGADIFQSEADVFSDFSKAYFKSMNESYPKFFKMDNLSKLAFLSAETLLKAEKEKEDFDQTAIVFANKSASLDTDVNYQSSIQSRDTYFPSPAVFVYTLPNICIGEISIKHRLMTESAFFVQSEFDSDFMHAYVENLLNSGKVKKVLCGWVEFFVNNYRSFLYLVGSEGKIDHTTMNIQKLYNQ